MPAALAAALLPHPRTVSCRAPVYIVLERVCAVVPLCRGPMPYRPVERPPASRKCDSEVQTDPLPASAPQEHAQQAPAQPGASAGAAAGAGGEPKAGAGGGKVAGGGRGDPDPLDSSSSDSDDDDPTARTRREMELQAEAARQAKAQVRPGLWGWVRVTTWVGAGRVLTAGRVFAAGRGYRSMHQHVAISAAAPFQTSLSPDAGPPHAPYACTRSQPWTAAACLSAARCPCAHACVCATRSWLPSRACT